MRSNRQTWVSVLGSILVILAAACSKTEERPPSSAPAEAESPEPQARSADKTLAPTPESRLAEEGGDVPREAATPPPKAATGPAETPTVDAEADSVSGDRSAPPSATAAPTTRLIAVPEGTSLPLVLTSSVASDTSQVEDPVSAKLTKAVTIDGVTAIPEGAVVNGTVSEAKRSGRVKGRAEVAFRFHTLVVGDEHYDIRTTPIAARAEPTKKKDTKKVAIPAAAGGVIGAIVGGGKGAAIGAAAGAAAGTGAVLVTRGGEVQFATGAQVTTTLSSPLEIRVKSNREGVTR